MARAPVSKTGCRRFDSCRPATRAWPPRRSPLLSAPGEGIRVALPVVDGLRCVGGCWLPSGGPGVPCGLGEWTRRPRRLTQVTHAGPLPGLREQVARLYARKILPPPALSPRARSSRAEVRDGRLVSEGGTEGRGALTAAGLSVVHPAVEIQRKLGSSSRPALPKRGAGAPPAPLGAGRDARDGPRCLPVPLHSSGTALSARNGGTTRTTPTTASGPSRSMTSECGPWSGPPASVRGCMPRRIPANFEEAGVQLFGPPRSAPLSRCWRSVRVRSRTPVVSA